MKLYEKTAAELSAMLQRKECSAVEIYKDVLARTDAVEAHIGAYITRCTDDGLQQAVEQRVAGGLAAVALKIVEQ